MDHAAYPLPKSTPRPSAAQVAGTLTVVPTSWGRSQKLLLLLADCISVASMHHATLIPFPKKAPPSSIGFLSTWDLSSPSPLTLPFRCSAISGTHPSIRVQCSLRISTQGNLRQRCQCCQCRDVAEHVRPTACGKWTYFWKRDGA